MTEKQLRRFLQVMVDNLVDSNVFMRSLVLSVEHSSFRQEFPGAGGAEGEEEDGDDEETAPRLGGSGAAAGDGAGLSAAGGDGCGRKGPLDAASADAERQGKCEEGVSDEGYDHAHGGEGGGWLDYDGDEEPCYLGHTWYDVQPQEVPEEEDKQGCPRASEDRGTEEGTEPVAAAGRKSEGKGEPGLREGRATAAAAAAALAASREAARVREAGRRAGTGGEEAGGQLTRLQCFLKHNTPQLVRDLMCVVNLETINHENICCLNTAVLILIFADRRGQLAEVREESVEQRGEHWLLSSRLLCCCIPTRCAWFLGRVCERPVG